MSPDQLCSFKCIKIAHAEHSPRPLLNSPNFLALGMGVGAHPSWCSRNSPKLSWTGFFFSETGRFCQSVRISQLQSLFGFCVCAKSVGVCEFSRWCLQTGASCVGKHTDPSVPGALWGQGVQGAPAALAEATGPWAVSGSPELIWAKQNGHWGSRVKLQQDTRARGEGTSP